MAVDPRYKRKLVEHLNFLARSCQAWDQGAHEESLRIATSARVLLHDTQMSTSVLTLLNGWSPNGRWLAYASDEAGNFQVFVRAYPGPGGKWQISTEGGYAPRWSPDGTELFYRWQRELNVLAVDGDADSFRASGRETLFDDLSGTVSADIDYDPIDANRFLIVELAGDDFAPPGVTVVVNWLDDLKRRVPN